MGTRPHGRIVRRVSQWRTGDGGGPFFGDEQNQGLECRLAVVLKLLLESHGGRQADDASAGGVDARQSSFRGA